MHRANPCVPARPHTALCALVLTLLVGCTRHGKEAPKGGSDIPPSQVKLKRNVELAQAERRALNYFVETVGYLEAEAQTDIAAGASGIVDEVYFREGQEVDENTVLLRIDARRYAALFAQAEANVKKAEANIKKAEANVKKAETGVARAKAGLRDVEKMYELKQILYDNARRAGAGVRPEEVQEKRAEVEMALAKREVASGDLHYSENETSVAEAEKAAADKEHEAAVALLAVAEHHLKRSQVRAPYRGQINQRKVSPGTHVEDKTTVATIADLRRLRLVGFIPEKAAPTVRELLAQQDGRRGATFIGLGLGGAPWGPVLTGLAASSPHLPFNYGLEFTLQPFPKRTFRARIFYLSTVANPDTHMFECKAEINTSGLDVELKPGFTARIKCLLRGNPDACVVPEEAVRASEKGFVAFVPVRRALKDGSTEWVARSRTLELGYRSPGSVEILQGLAPGEWLVRRGAEALEDGTPLRFAEEAVLSASPEK